MSRRGGGEAGERQMGRDTAGMCETTRIRGGGPRETAMARMEADGYGGRDDGAMSTTTPSIQTCLEITAMRFRMDDMRARPLMRQANCPINEGVSGALATRVRSGRIEAIVTKSGWAEHDDPRIDHEPQRFSSLARGSRPSEPSPPCSRRCIERPPASPPSGGRLDSRPCAPRTPSIATADRPPRGHGGRRCRAAWAAVGRERRWVPVQDSAAAGGSTSRRPWPAAHRRQVDRPGGRDVRAGERR